MGLAKYLLLCFCLLFSLSAVGQASLQLIDAEKTHSLTDQMRILIDADGGLTIEQVLAMRRDFQWPAQHNPNYGFGDEAIWFTTSFSNVSQQPVWLVDVKYAQNDNVDIYLVAQGKIIAHSKQGKAQAEQRFRYPSMEATLPYATRLDLYIRIQSDAEARVVPVTLSSESLHMKKQALENILWGVFYGGLMVLLFYNLTLFISLRDTSLLVYCTYIATVLIWQFVWGGHIQVYWQSPVADWLNQHTDLLFLVIAVTAGIFTYSFLDAKQNAPKAGRIIIALIGIEILLGLASLGNFLDAGIQNGAVYLVSMLAISSYLYAGYESYANQFKPARYFVFAWSILLTAALAGLLGLIGWLPTNFLTTYCFQMGVFLEAVLFSLALMEKSQTQLSHSVDLVTNDLRNNMEIIEEQNARLDIARKQAIQASKIKSQFLANMSHEIRTPLNAILGFSQELANTPLPTEKQEHVRIINASANNLLNIINDVLDFSKIEAGKLQINNEPFCPTELLEELAGLMARSAHAKGLELISDLSPLPKKLIGDAARIRQVLTNLVGNAIKFTRHGHVRLAVKGEDQANGLYELVFKIEDTGIGISREDRHKLFSAFSQLDGAINREYQGTGLGLAICQELVKLMRGSIELHSEQGAGTEFTVKLRVNKLSQKMSLSPYSRWKGKQVLIYEAYPPARQAMGRMFKALGAVVTSCDSFDYLAMQTGPFDYLFLSCPEQQCHSYQAKLASLETLRARHKVLLDSAPRPSQQDMMLAMFERRIERPLTLGKLENLLHPPTPIQNDNFSRQLKSLPKASVLAVDDMEINLRLLATWLRDSPVELSLSFNGQDAADRCEKEAFDLILMDVQMPGIDGLAASRMIRKTHLNRGTPIIAVTAHAFREEKEKLLNSGMDDYLPKPINFDDLIKLIKRWCQPTSEESLDWAQAMQLANDNPHHARQMLDAFIEQLPSMHSQIKAAAQAGDQAHLQYLIHKLHGACCYTGVPKLKTLCQELEEHLKTGHIAEVKTLLESFYRECLQVEEQGLEFLQGGSFGETQHPA
ncbi:response regulator [Bowmanella sp. Y26]|uniref:hybrid sensor histidine kinase/response regulator n=1 Tax=Bowmanella yangjiangensis TaxID=2811230 RepID=UPI001BDC48F1|nr:hybrid sensor histidine kinase/response regulator [Bowmanella yangjiangensis]MBT1064336.1 response regulator [Bowmanella yangjiangensis]